MGLLEWFILSLGAVGIASGSKCVPESAECSRYWVKLEPHKNLMESEKELNMWCRKRGLFYKCLENALLGKNGNLFDLPTNLLISKMFSEDLCTYGSNSQRRYLSNAACINRLNTEYCTLPEYLDIVKRDDAIPSSGCSRSEKTFSCIAATIVMNCGFDAGKVYRYLLKVTNCSEVVCNIESSEGVPPCEDPKIDNRNREEELSEIFYGLVNRFGIIPEQVGEQDDPSFFSHDATESPVTENAESVISEAIRNALDAIDEDSSPEEYDKDFKSQVSENVEFQATERYSETLDEGYIKNPIITEPFKGLLHYNYSGHEFAIYWRQPDEFLVDSVECEHLLPSFLKGVIFRCLLYRRLRDPDCVASVAGGDEPITPGLIRDIDPDVPRDSIIDFGPRPYWMTELYEYKRQKELREQSTVSMFSESMSPEASAVDSVTESETPPAACTSKTRVHKMVHNPDFKWWKCPSLFSEGLRKEIISVLLPDLTEDYIPLMSAFHSNNIGYMYLYEPRLHEFDSIICARVNECHPRGRGIFKCAVKPREIKQCYNCYEESRYPSPAFDNLRNIKTTPSDPKPSSEEADTVAVDRFGSGDAEYEVSSDRLMTLLLSRNEAPDSEDKAHDMGTEDIVAEEDELFAINISTEISEQSRTDASPRLRLLILDQDAKESNLESAIISDNVHAVGSVMDDQENYSSYALSSDDEYRLLHDDVQDDVLVLQGVQPQDVHAIYEILDNQDENESSRDAIEVSNP